MPSIRKGRAGLGAFDLLSTDVFDTLLLRDGRCESERLSAVAARSAAGLAAQGIARAPRLLLATRVQAQKLAYRATEAADPLADIRLEQILLLQTRLLGLGAEAVDTLRRSEMDEEAATLRPNRPLLEELRAASAAGIRVVAISDTYLAAAELSALVTSVVGAHPIQRFHTSADWRRTKRAGGLFERVAAAEGVKPDRILHLGDDAHADLAMAQRAGLQASHRPRPRNAVLRRAISRLYFDLTRPGAAA